MSIRLKDNDSLCIDYDSCGNTVVTVLEINGILIPLCSSCLEELKEIIIEEE